MSRFDDGYTGHLFEEETLGKCLATHRGHLKWHEAMEVVRKNQPRVKTPVAAALEAGVRKETGVPVVFYTAVRSTLDRKHSVDAFFEFRGVVVTIDLTMNDDKDVCKADLLVAKEEIDNIPLLAGRIARELKSRLSRRS
jgi:hypothetical protein